MAIFQKKILKLCKFLKKNYQPYSLATDLATYLYTLQLKLITIARILQELIGFQLKSTIFVRAKNVDTNITCEILRSFLKHVN